MNRKGGSKGLTRGKLRRPNQAGSAEVIFSPYVEAAQEDPLTFFLVFLTLFLSLGFLAGARGDTTLTRLGMKMLYFRIFIAFLTSRERRLEAARAPSGCLDTDRGTHSQWLLEQCKSIRLL